MGEGGNSVFFGFLLAGGSTYVCSSVWFFFLCCVRMKKIYINTFYIYFWFF
jgi:hypothetical protein